MGHNKAVPRRISLCLMAVCLMAGCERKSEQGEKLALEIQEEWRNMASCDGEVKLEAQYEDRAFSCVVTLEYDRQQGGRLTFVEPELVKGITVGVREGGLTLSQGDVLVDTGPILSDGTSPVESLGTLYRLATEGFLGSAEAEGENLSVTCRQEEGNAGEGIEGVFCLDSRSHLPLTAQLYEDGVLVISAEFRDMSLTEEEKP